MKKGCTSPMLSKYSGQQLETFHKRCSPFTSTVIAEKNMPFKCNLSYLLNLWFSSYIKECDEKGPCLLMIKFLDAVSKVQWIYPKGAKTGNKKGRNKGTKLLKH